MQAYDAELGKVGNKGTAIASAASIDLGAATGDYVHITGTTTITAMGTADAGTRRRVVFDGILSLTHNATSLILFGADITTAAGDTAVFVSEGSGNWRCLGYQRADGTPLALIDEDSFSTNSATRVPSQQSVKAYVDAKGVKGRSAAVYTSNAGLTTTIPGDDSIPQITEGTQILSTTYTPTSATNRLRIRFNGQVASSIQMTVIAALFNGASNAIAARIISTTGSNAKHQIGLEHTMVAGTTDATTFSIRIGPSSAATVVLNGDTNGRLLGGASEATLIVEEIAP